MRQGDQFQTSFCLLKKALYQVKAGDLQLSFNHFRQSSTWQTIETKYINLQTINPEICSILIIQKRAWKYFLHHILCVIFQEKCFSSYILATHQFSLPGCLYFLIYWSISVLQLFVNQTVTLQILKLMVFFQSSRLPT